MRNIITPYANGQLYRAATSAYFDEGEIIKFKHLTSAGEYVRGGCALEAIANAFPRRVGDLVSTAEFLRCVETQKNAWLTDENVETILNQMHIRFRRVMDSNEISSYGNPVFIVANSFHWYTYRMKDGGYLKFDGFGYSTPESVPNIESLLRDHIEDGEIDGCYIISSDANASTSREPQPYWTPSREQEHPQTPQTPGRLPTAESINDISDEIELTRILHRLIPPRDMTPLDTAFRLSLMDVVQERIQTVRNMKIERDAQLAQEMSDRELATRLQRMELSKRNRGGRRGGRDRQM